MYQSMNYGLEKCVRKFERKAYMEEIGRSVERNFVKVKRKVISGLRICTKI